MYLLLTSDHCSRCTVIKSMLTSKNIEYQELNLSRHPDPDLVNKLKIRSAGTLINIETGKIINPKDL